MSYIKSSVIMQKQPSFPSLSLGKAHSSMSNMLHLSKPADSLATGLGCMWQHPTDCSAGCRGVQARNKLRPMFNTSPFIY